jgi:uncharacterized protein (DUF1684 family)
VLSLAAVVAIIMMITFFFHSASEENDQDYVKKIQAYRFEKDRTFRKSESSPIEGKANFDGLNYFYPDKNYIVTARLEFAKDSIPYTILRSDSRSETYLKYATAIFELHRKEHKVTLLKPLHDETGFLFFPFADLTSGRETYGGGRYLDLEIPEKNQKTIKIDFNLAYNPYCVYNYRYSCPLPPKENFIDAEIRAGEKSYKD